MNSTTELPYELHTQGSGAFVIFNVAEQIALPLIALARATLRSPCGDEMILEFHDTEVAIEGRGLVLLLEHLLAGRVRKITCAHSSACEITSIRVKEAR